jgi:hypothetical protein
MQKVHKKRNYDSQKRKYSNKNYAYHSLYTAEICLLYLQMVWLVIEFFSIKHIVVLGDELFCSLMHILKFFNCIFLTKINSQKQRSVIKNKNIFGMAACSAIRNN